MTTGLTLSEAHNLLGLLGRAREASRMKQLQGKVSREIRIVAAPPGVAAYVVPDQSRMIYVSWYTALCGDVDFKTDVLRHEDIHLKHKESWDMEIPFLNRLQPVHLSNIEHALGMNPLVDFTQILEGFTEGSLSRKRGHTDDRIAYAQHEVPMIERLDGLIQAKSGGSLLDDFGKMTAESRGDFLTHFRRATNSMMLERSMCGIIDTHRVIFPPQGTRRDKLQQICAWYEETFPSSHVIETEQESQKVLDLYDELHGLALVS